MSSKWVREVEVLFNNRFINVDKLKKNVPLEL